MRRYKLKEISNIYNGSTPSTSDASNYDGDIIWITPKDLSNQKSKYVSKGERNITEKGYKNCSTTMLPKGTILLSSRAPIGLLAIAKTELCTNQGFKNIVPQKELVDNNYLYYLLRLKIKEIEALGSGTTFKEVSKTSLENYEIDIHDIAEQQKISNILNAIDDKIALNNKINQELEQMAKTLYDYWFVQFDFPDEKGRPYKSANGKMVYNEVLKREIPEGWEVGTFASYIKQDKGGDWGKDECAGNYIKKVYCIRGADFPSLTGHSSCKAPIRFILNKNSSKILSSGDLVIEISGGSPTQSTGRIGYINQHVLERFDDDVITSNFCKALSLNNKNTLYNFYLEWERLYKSGLFFNYEGKTTGIKNLLFDTFVESYKIAIPPQNIINAFYDTVRNIFEKIQCNAKENHYLETIRDFLLPLLMNGQVTISSEH